MQSQKKYSYNRILLKISGESLMGKQTFGLDPDFLSLLCQEIKAVYNSGVQLALVIGGGNFFRGVNGASIGLERIAADHMGMLATVMNGIALQNVFKTHGIDSRTFSALHIPTICEHYNRDQALRYIESGKIVICVGGTGDPYFTTDSAAALRAAELECDVIFKATKVDGVYTKDPMKNSDAEFLAQLTYKQVLVDQLKVMDATAISIAQESKIPIVVFSINNPQGIMQAIKGEGRFSIIQ